MIKPLTPRQKKMIVNNVIRATRNIHALSRSGYRFLYLCSGFIAHYDLGGFIAYYADHDLRTDILQHVKNNEYRNFKPGDEYFDYYQSKADVYRQIAEAIQ